MRVRENERETCRERELASCLCAHYVIQTASEPPRRAVYQSRKQPPVGHDREDWCVTAIYAFITNVLLYPFARFPKPPLLAEKRIFSFLSRTGTRPPPSPPLTHWFLWFRVGVWCLETAQYARSHCWARLGCVEAWSNDVSYDKKPPATGFPHRTRSRTLSAHCEWHVANAMHTHRIIRCRPPGANSCTLTFSGQLDVWLFIALSALHERFHLFRCRP